MKNMKLQAPTSRLLRNTTIQLLRERLPRVIPFGAWSFFVLILSLFVQSAHAQLLVEHFNYGNGNLGAAGVGDTLWSGGDSANVALTVNSSAALTNSGLAGASGSGIIFNGGTFKKKAAPFVS